MEDPTFLFPTLAPVELLHQEEEAAFRQNLVPVDPTFLLPFQAWGEAAFRQNLVPVDLTFLLPFQALEVGDLQSQAVPEAVDHTLQERGVQEASHLEDHILLEQEVLGAYHRGELGACHHREDQVAPVVPFLHQEGHQNLVVCYSTAKVCV